MRTITLTILAAALMLPSVAFAQGNHRERLADRHERGLDRRHRAADVVDRAQIGSIRHAWTAAVDSGNRAAERAADVRLRGWLGRELRESRREVGQAHREQRRSRGERDRSRRERNRSGTRDDRRDLRDDRRDLRDDRRDTAVAAGDLARTRSIAAQLNAMQPAFAGGTATRAQYARKRQLLNRLVGLANAEVRRDTRELREDRRETREDHRERREDRRARRRRR